MAKGQRADCKKMIRIQPDSQPQDLGWIVRIVYRYEKGDLTRGKSHRDRVTFTNRLAQHHLHPHRIILQYPPLNTASTN